MALDPVSREPLIALFGFQIDDVGREVAVGMDGVLQYRGGVWQPVGITTQLPGLAYT